MMGAHREIPSCSLPAARSEDFSVYGLGDFAPGGSHRKFRPIVRPPARPLARAPRYPSRTPISELK